MIITNNDDYVKVLYDQYREQDRLEEKENNNETKDPQITKFCEASTEVSL